MMINNYVKIAVLAAVFGSGWYVNGLRYNKIIADTREEHQQILNQARNRADEAERLAAETRATVIEKEKVITRDIIKYVKTTDRTVCVYDNERVRIKSDILRTADPRRGVAD